MFVSRHGLRQEAEARLVHTIATQIGEDSSVQHDENGVVAYVRQVVALSW